MCFLQVDVRSAPAVGSSVGTVGMVPRCFDVLMMLVDVGQLLVAKSCRMEAISKYFCNLCIVRHGWLMSDAYGDSPGRHSEPVPCLEWVHLQGLIDVRCMILITAESLIDITSN